MKIFKDISFSHIDSFLFRLLPKQGCIELQSDAPNKEHDWHQHENNETLIVLKGGFTLYTKKEIVPCYTGYLIELPAYTAHRSVAFNEGAVYIITFRYVRELISSKL